nr:CapA family protein [Lachnospiraceae bacterium]
MRKSSKKKWIYFGVTLVLTLIIGTIGLFLYSRVASKPDPVVSDEVVVSEIVTDAQQENTEEEETSGGLPGAGAGSEDGETEETADENAPDEQKEAGTVTLTFGGDICFHDEYANMYALSTRGGSIESCIGQELLDEMRQSDICMVNNEFPYSDRGTPLPEKAFTFRSKPENVKLLHEMGVDIVSLANNHAYDHGETALLDTFDILEGAGIKYVGAGRNLDEASKAEVFEVNGVRVGILSATQIERLDNPDTKGATEGSAGVLRCFNGQELDHFLGLVTETKKECDILIVYIHWGTENTDELDWAQPYQADLISKAGVDLIVGAHPHCLQGLDSVNGVPVVYSLGNYWFNSKAMDTALLKVTAGKDAVQTIQIIPARQQDCSTSILKDSEKQRVLQYLDGLSENVAIDAEGFMTW